MASRFGHDFGHVRVHADGAAARAAEAISARAFTVGQHVAFGAGAYAPGTTEGDRLIAHELAHVVQQRGAAPAGPLELGAADDEHERAADSAADAVLAGRSPGALANTLRLGQVGRRVMREIDLRYCRRIAPEPPPVIDVRESAHESVERRIVRIPYAGDLADFRRNVTCAMRHVFFSPSDASRRGRGESPSQLGARTERIVAHATGLSERHAQLHGMADGVVVPLIARISYHRDRDGLRFGSLEFVPPAADTAVPARSTTDPHPGRVYAELRGLLQLPCMHLADFESLIDQRFNPGAVPCRRGQAPSANCSYSTLILGESHTGLEEHDLALQVLSHFLDRYRNGTAPAFREETQGGSGRGLLTDEFHSAHAHPALTPRQLFQTHGVSAVGLADFEQFEAPRWAPGLVRSNPVSIVYVGNAHTSRAYLRWFRALLPEDFNMSAGSPILETIEAANRRGLVLTMQQTDDLLRTLEVQAYREMLLTYPSEAEFSAWQTVFTREWGALTRGISGTCVRQLAPDVYFALTGSYSGPVLEQRMRTAWADPALGGRIRADRHWELYSTIPSTALRFHNTGRETRQYLEAEFDPRTGRVTRVRVNTY